MRTYARLLAVAAVAGGVLLAGRPLSAPVESPLDRALSKVRAQDPGPLFELAGDRIQGAFRREHEEAFVAELMSASGKWKALTRGKASYEKHVRKLFEKTVFGPAQLEALLEGLRGDLLHGFAALENRLLVEIEADVRVARPELCLPELRAEYGRLAEELAPQVARDLGLNVVSFAAGEAATALGLSALAAGGAWGGAIAAGGAAGAATFGAGLLLGLGAGLAVDWAVGDVFEDVARTEVRRAVTQLRGRVLDAVYAALGDAVLRHRALQEARVRALFGGGTHGGMAHRP
jgi:hypothetical protein